MIQLQLLLAFWGTIPCVDSAPALRETTHSTHCSPSAGLSSGTAPLSL